MIGGQDVLEALPVAVCTTDAEGLITFYNAAAAALWGYRPELGSSRWCGSWKLYWPDGRPMPHDQCPLATALREGRPVRGEQAVAERPDGSRVPFLAFPTPLRDAEGRLTGAVNLLMDLTGEQNRDIDSARLAAIVASSDDAIVTKTLDGIITSWNASATRILGYLPHEIVGQSIKRIVPTDLWPEEDAVLARLKRGERIEHFDTQRMTKDGRRIDLSITVSPLRDKFGNLVGASKVARDIGERKRAQQLQTLLFDELNHRVKNTLATIQAIASQSLRRAASTDQFVASFAGRLQALARAHDRLVKGEMQGADVGGLVADQVLQGGGDDPRITASGPALRLDGQAAVQLALVLHELATNAQRFGALSLPGGSLAVRWALLPDSRPTLQLAWRESGVAEVAAPVQRGFGAMLIERTLQAHGGTATLRFDPGGITCEIHLPLPERTFIAGRHGSPAPAIDRPPTLPGTGPASPLSKRRILVIEDEPLVAMELEAILADAGCRIVGPAGTIESARQLIDAGKIDAALVDANLGGRRVDDLAASLSERSIPFGFVTGYGREALPARFQHSRMLSKPFMPAQLLALVSALLKPAE